MPIDLPFRGREAEFRDLIRTVSQLHTDMQRVLRRLPDRAGESGPPDLPGGDPSSGTDGAECYRVTLGANVTRGSSNVSCTIVTAYSGSKTGTIDVDEPNCLKTGDTAASGSSAVVIGTDPDYVFVVLDCDNIS